MCASKNECPPVTEYDAGWSGAFFSHYDPPNPDNDAGPTQRATDDGAAEGGDRSSIPEGWRELTPTTADEVFKEIGAEILHTPVAIATATRKRENWNWVTPEGEFGYLLTQYYLEHKEGPKDGRCILQGSLNSGQRKKENVKACYIVLQDFDNGDTMEEIAARVPPGTFCLLHHTHSHLKPESDYAEKGVLDWLEETGQEGGALTVEQARAYMRARTEVRKEIIDSVHSVEKKHVEGGVRFFIHHAPMHRVRAMYILAKSFIFAERGTPHAVAIKEWSERYLGLAAERGASIDEQCIDPSRLMYTPRRPPGGDPSLYKIMVQPGGPLDFESVPRVASKKRAEDGVAVDAPRGSNQPRRSDERIAFRRALARLDDYAGREADLKNLTEAWFAVGVRLARWGEAERRTLALKPLDARNN